MDQYKFVEEYTGEKLLPFQKKVVDMFIIKEIEEAMGFKLYELQRSYILGEQTYLGYDPNNRRRGLTTAHCIKLALSDGEPLNLHKMHEVCDMQHFDRSQLYRYASWYRDHFLFIRNKLEDHGFKVRKVFK